MVYNTQIFEYAIRTLSIEQRKNIDKTIKDFIKNILLKRGQLYNDHSIPLINKIGKDNFAGRGTHTWLYKLLISEKKYDIDGAQAQTIRDNKRRKLETGDWELSQFNSQDNN